MFTLVTSAERRAARRPADRSGGRARGGRSARAPSSVAARGEQQAGVVVDPAGDEADERRPAGGQRPGRPRERRAGQQLAHEREREQRGEPGHQRRHEPHGEQPREEVAADRVVGHGLDEVVERRVVRSCSSPAPSESRPEAAVEQQLQRPGPLRRPRRASARVADDLVEAQALERPPFLLREDPARDVPRQLAGLRDVLRVGEVLGLVRDVERAASRAPTPSVQEHQQRAPAAASPTRRLKPARSAARARPRRPRRARRSTSGVHGPRSALPRVTRCAIAAPSAHHVAGRAARQRSVTPPPRPAGRATRAAVSGNVGLPATARREVAAVAQADLRHGAAAGRAAAGR